MKKTFPRGFYRIEIERAASHDNERTIVPDRSEVFLVFGRGPSHHVKIAPLRDLSIERCDKNNDDLHITYIPFGRGTLESLKRSSPEKPPSRGRIIN